MVTKHWLPTMFIGEGSEITSFSTTPSIPVLHVPLSGQYIICIFAHVMFSARGSLSSFTKLSGQYCVFAHVLRHLLNDTLTTS